MPLSMKVQPIGSHEESTESLAPIAPPRVVVKSRLRRLFRISTGGGGTDESAAVTTITTTTGQGHAAVGGDNYCFEPSSVCLAKMVQNFLEAESDNKQSSGVKCGRNRCNCFNGGSDSSDAESDGMDVTDSFKSLVLCESVAERNVLADTAKIVEWKNSKGCSKRKDDLRKAVVESLISLGYDASLCRSKWEKSPSFPAGEYEYVDVLLIGGSGERLIIDVDFRSEFEIARSTKLYKHVLQTLPNIFVGKPDRLKKIIGVASEAVKQCLKKKGMHFPPWRKAEYFEAKWLSPPTRLLIDVGSVVGLKKGELTTKSGGTGNCEDVEEEEEEEEEGEKESSCSSESASASASASPVGDGECNNPLFAMSESSCEEEEEDGDDEVEEKLKPEV